MKRYPLKKKLSLRENLQNIIPVMYDELMLYKNEVVTRPLAKSTLHRMRITGKPLRYALEIGEPAFGKEFALCLEEVKNTVELMGEIHDADVMIPELNSQLKELRLFNKTLKGYKERISTAVLRNIIAGQKQKRGEMYAELCLKLNRWEKEFFRDKLLKAMGVEPVTEFRSAGGI